MEQLEERVGFYTFEQTRRFASEIGSSRIRAHWLIRHWPQAELFTLGRQYTCLILQKVYWLEGAKHFPGIKILDLCDPDFLHWKCPLRQLADLCDAVTTSTEALADFVRQYTAKPVACIPDRLDLASFGNPKRHAGTGPTTTAAWFGYSANFPMLDNSIPALLENGIRKLIVVASQASPYSLPEVARDRIELVNYPWESATVNQHLRRAHVVLNWQVQYGKWRFKSNNKTTTAWALGLPVAHNGDELAKLMTEDARVRESEVRLSEVRERYDVRQSVRDYQNLIAQLRNDKTAAATAGEQRDLVRAGA
jgi:hypothetical protein